MTALSAPADRVWDLVYVAVSLIVGGALGAAGLRIFSRGRGLRSHLTAALALTLAIAGLHFAAMTALTLKPNLLADLDPGMVLAPSWLAFAIAGGMALVVTLGMIGTIFDHHLTERAVQEAVRLRVHVEELESTRMELQAANRNLERALTAAAAASQAKSQFLATMSHELRTPLNAIIGFSEMIDTEIFGPLGDARYKSYIKDVHASGKHLLKLVNEVLDFSKLDAGHLELEEDLVNVADLVSSTLRMVTTQADSASIRLRKDIPAELPMLHADERRLKQVLLNLLSNAIKFTNSGGEVTVSASLEPSGLSLAVQDTGIGMAPEDIPRALERFGQIDSTLGRMHEGAGLGLPLAKKLVELHGGILSIESTLNVGTRITVTLPASRFLEARAIA